MKTQVKIALYLTITNTLMLLLFGGSLYYFLYNYSYTDFYKRLETRAKISAKYNLDSDTVNSESFKMIREEYLEKLSHEQEYLHTIKDEASLGELAQASGLPLGFFKETRDKGVANLQIGDRFYAGIRYTGKDREQHIVVVSANNYYASHHLVFLRNILLAGIVLIIIITTGLSIYFSRYFFAPIRKITDKVRQISTDSFHLRVEESFNDKEISELISTFNDLLNRLETAFEAQKNFISNASHEFATPLTSIMGMAEVTLMKERSAAEYQQSLQSILEQADRINQITQSLLFLAQTGYSNKSIRFETLRADELIWQAKDIVDKLNPKSNISVDLSLLPETPKKLKISGNRQLLNLAFANILNNACKYSNNKQVSVSIASSNDQVILFFRDAGIGIPADEMPFIYDPFFRASNTHLYEGYGIGLPLTRNIIRIHNGQLDITSQPGEGTVVEIRIPLIPQT